MGEPGAVATVSSQNVWLMDWNVPRKVDHLIYLSSIAAKDNARILSNRQNNRIFYCRDEVGDRDGGIAKDVRQEDTLLFIWANSIWHLHCLTLVKTPTVIHSHFATPYFKNCLWFSVHVTMWRHVPKQWTH